MSERMLAAAAAAAQIGMTITPSSQWEESLKVCFNRCHDALMSFTGNPVFTLSFVFNRNTLNTNFLRKGFNIYIITKRMQENE